MVRQEFEKNIKEITDKERIFTKKSISLSYLRGAVALIFVISLILFSQWKLIAGVVSILLVFPVIFGLLVNRHNKIKYQRNQYQFLRKINEDEIKRLQLELGSFPKGDKYIDSDHPFAVDLDVFGNHSLYQLINRTSTWSGSEKLAQWLKNQVPDKAEIEERQIAIKELAPQIEWRQNFQAHGMHFQSKDEVKSSAFSWINEGEKKGFRVSNLLILLLSLGNLTSVIAFFSFNLPLYFLILPIGISILLLRKVFNELKELSEATYQSSQILKTYQKLILLIEGLEVKSPKLIQLQSEFKYNDRQASGEVKKLEKMVDRIQSRVNLLYAMINVIFLLDLRILNHLDKWLAENRVHLVKWFDAMAEMEALCSIAALAYANPDFSFPILSTGEPTFTAENVGHPLLPAEKRIGNTFSMHGKGTMILITDSNMSGKSTFLRTIGTNVLLANIGGPICATTGEITLLRLYSAMRTVDTLEKSVSSFYAELIRLKSLIRIIPEHPIPVLFMLDEILKGTNSFDRNTGASALIDQLSKTHSFGLVSTHDIALGEKAETNPKVINMSFHSSFIDGKLQFDHLLRRGVCTESNAAVLMKMMGIDI